MIDTDDERRRLSLQLVAQLRRLADLALAADHGAVARALVYAQRVGLELARPTTDRRN